MQNPVPNGDIEVDPGEYMGRCPCNRCTFDRTLAVAALTMVIGARPPGTVVGSAFVADFFDQLKLRTDLAPLYSFDPQEQEMEGNVPRELLSKSRN